jgi:hypothetical protein
MPLDVEAVKQRLLRHRPLTHHRPLSAHLSEIESGRRGYFKTEFFNTIRAQAAYPAPLFLATHVCYRTLRS